jgi:hypothetical protein
MKNKINLFNWLKNQKRNAHFKLSSECCDFGLPKPIQYLALDIISSA